MSSEYWIMLFDESIIGIKYLRIISTGSNIGPRKEHHSEFDKRKGYHSW